MISKIQGYLLAAGAAVVTLIGVFLSGRQSGKDAVNLDNAEYQKESLENAYKSLEKATKEGRVIKDDAIEKADNDDFTGFNNKL